jgi:hypothetical protein
MLRNAAVLLYKALDVLETSNDPLFTGRPEVRRLLL